MPWCTSCCNAECAFTNSHFHSHLKYTIPPAIVLTFLYRPLFTKLDIYKILFLITIAVTSTIPWDSYLIRTNIWSYPRDVIIGPKLFDIPLEEVFFFVIQTYNTTLLYLFLSKPTFHPIYLKEEAKADRWKYFKLLGQLALALVLKRAITMVRENKEGTYLGLILLWAVPFLLLLWSLAYQLILRLPLSNTAFPIFLPTLYLWIVDTLALRRGTWVIEAGTKIGIHLWPGLEIEEAIFFLVTNTLIVFGLIAFDNAVAILDAFPYHFPNPPAMPSPYLLVRALLLPATAYDNDRLTAIRQAVQRLQKKSRSFYLASGVFERRLRVDLILLYSFCRVADDLVDDAKDIKEARQWIKKLTQFLLTVYTSKDKTARDPNRGAIALYVVENFPRNTHNALLHLPTDRLSSQPLFDLLKGFEMDLEFHPVNTAAKSAEGFPIKTQDDLDRYGSRVAGTVAELCIDLAFFHVPGKLTEADRKSIKLAGHNMGIALQYTNIARDIQVDSKINRVYIPGTWLKKENLTSGDFLKQLQAYGASSTPDAAFGRLIERLRGQLLDRSFTLYEESRPAIERLPSEVRASMRVAVESYMEIGRVLLQKDYVVKQGRATVPKMRRLTVAYKALSR